MRTVTDSVDFSSPLFPLLNVGRKANSSPFSLGSYRTLSSHKLTLTRDFKGARDSRGEKKGACIHLGPVPSRDEMELISRSVQRGPRGAAAGGALPTGAGRGVSFDSSRLSPLDTCGVRAPSAGPGAALDRKSAVIAIQPVGRRQEATITGEEHTARFLFVLMCLRKDATSSPTEQRRHKVLAIKCNLAEVAEEDASPLWRCCCSLGGLC